MCYVQKQNVVQHIDEQHKVSARQVLAPARAIQSPVASLSIHIVHTRAHVILVLIYIFCYTCFLLYCILNTTEN